MLWDLVILLLFKPTKISYLLMLPYYEYTCGDKYCSCDYSGFCHKGSGEIFGYGPAGWIRG